MASFFILFHVSMLAVAVVSIYVLVSSGTISLPIALGTRILAIILPLLATANFHLTPVVHRIFRKQNYAAAVLLAPSTSNIVQGVLTVVLATLSFEGVLPGAGLKCGLHNAWQDLWRHHDSRGIERIQDAFNCCGLLSLKDMSEPHRGTDTSLCSTMYHRSTPCIGPWTDAMRRNSGLEFGVALAVGLFQLINLFLTRNTYNQSRRGCRRLTHHVDASPHDPLLGHDTEDDSASTEVEEEGRPRFQGYGSTDGNARPRVEPSNLSEENSHWRI